METTRRIPLVPDLSVRSTEAELIDDPVGLTVEETERMLQELGLVNRWLGGRRVLLRMAAPLIESLSSRLGGREVRVADLGSGGGDLGRTLIDWSRSRRIQVRVIGVDFSHVTNRAARRHSRGYPELEFVTADIGGLPYGSVHISLCSAFLHHFESTELPHILSSTCGKTSHAVLISDLERSLIAYWGIVGLTRLFSRSRAVQNDGPLSVLRGFRKSELEQVVRQVGLGRPRVRRSWAFRLSCVLDCVGESQRTHETNAA